MRILFYFLFSAFFIFIPSLPVFAQNKEYITPKGKNTVYLPDFSQNFSKRKEYVNIGPKTTVIHTIVPYYVEIFISAEDNNYVAKLYNLNEQIKYIEREIRLIHTSQNINKELKKQIESSAPIDNTRVNKPLVLPDYNKKSKNIKQKGFFKRYSFENLYTNITQKFEIKKEQGQITKKEELLKLLSSVKKQRDDLLNKRPNLSDNIALLNTQNKINDAYVLYQHSADWYNNQKPPQGFTLPPQEIAQVINKTYKLSPKELQTKLSYELTAINKKMQQGSGYKSFVALESEVEKINKNSREDAILMSIFTFVTTYKLTGTKITAPASALHWWSGPMWSYRAKKLLNFIMALSIYGAIDEVNLKAVGASFEEMITRFTFLQDNYGYLKDVIPSTQKNAINFNTKSLPNNWTDDNEHRRAVKRLYALKFINLYLSLSSVSYKYDLALMDLMNLFSDKPEVYFDFTVFDKYENGSWNKTEKTNYLPTQNMAFNSKYGASSASALIPRSQNMINNLKKLPKHLYYKKVYYKGLPDNEDSLAEVYFNFMLSGIRVENTLVREGGMILYPVPPQSIIRDQKGNLRDCSLTHKTHGGEYMDIYNGNYYMRIEPAANDTGTFYRGKPKTYVFEDINTKTHECGRQTNLIMA